MRPDYLAIGVESNVLLTREPRKWRQFKDLYRESYRTLKRLTRLYRFFTTEVLHYKRLTKEAKGTDQEREVAELMKQSDLFAHERVSAYEHGTATTGPRELLRLRNTLQKPIAVSESGMTSRNVAMKSYGLVLSGSDADQEQFTELLLKTAAREKYEFVINFATTDFERLVIKLRLPQDDIARIWAFTGMQTGIKNQSPPWLNGTPTSDGKSFASGDHNARRVQIVPAVQVVQTVSAQHGRAHCLAGFDHRIK